MPIDTSNLEFRDNVLEFTNTTGTGPLILTGSTSGYVTALAAFGAGDHESIWKVQSANRLHWEMFVGTVNGTTLTRDAVLSSSSGGAAVDFPVGKKEVRCTFPAELLEAFMLDAASLANAIRSDGSVNFAADQSLAGHKLTNLGTPTNANDAASKTYVDTGLATKQAADATLTALAGVTTAAGSVVVATGVDTFTVSDSTAYGRSLWNVADEATLKALVNLEIGVDVQAQNVNLAALSGLSLTANKLPYGNGTNTLALTDLTAFARSLLDDSDAATARGTLGLGTLATQNAAAASVTEITVANTGLHLLDTDASHDLIIASGSNLTADRTLSIVTGDSNRTLTMTGNATVNQDVSSTSISARFNNLGLGTAASASSFITANGTLTGTIPITAGFFPTLTAATTGWRGLYFEPTFSGAFTCPAAYGIEAAPPNLSGGASVTTYASYRIRDVSGPTTSYGLVGEMSAGSGKYNIALTGNANNLSAGPWIHSSSAAPTLVADQAAIYAADVTAGNRAIHVKTESGQVIKCYQEAAVADATDAASAITQLNSLLAKLRSIGWIAT